MNSIHKYIIRTTESLLNLVIIFVLCIVTLFSVYCLWDNQQIYAAAEIVQTEMMKLKPEPEEPGPSFEELMAVNEDVCAWLTLDNTQIDYPILQGDEDLTYLNTDIYGNFSLAGSIFLDVRNNRNFTDAYSLVYGHHMANNEMFGDLDLYKEKEFFEENKTGVLILPDRAYSLKIFSCLLVASDDPVIFEPQKWVYDTSGVIRYAENNSLHVHEEYLQEIKTRSNVQILSLSTCSHEYDDARTIVLAVMEPYEE